MNKIINRNLATQTLQSSSILQRLCSKHLQQTNQLLGQREQFGNTNQILSFKQKFNQCRVPYFQFTSINEFQSYQDIPSNIQEQNDQSIDVKVDDQKELLLSGGGCAISYQAGYMHGLSEFIPKKVLKQYRVGGVSSGSCIASFFICSVYSDKDMKYWYEKYIRKNLQQVNEERLGFLYATKFMVDYAKQAYEEAQIYKIPFNGTLHVYISPRDGIFGLKKHLVDTFTDSQQFAESISCSCAIPFVTTNSFSNAYQGIQAIDGGITMALPFRDQDSDCIFLNVLPKMFSEFPIVRERPDFLSVIHIAQDNQLRFPQDYFTWDLQTADKYFLNGYLASHKQQKKLLRAFKII